MRTRVAAFPDVLMIASKSLSLMGMPGGVFSNLRIQTILSGFFRVF